MRLSDFGFTLRPATDKDKAYILSTAIRSVYEVVRGPAIPKASALIGIRDVAEALLPYVSVAVHADDPATIHAWIAAHNGKLFWIYVPHALRRRGVAKALLEAAVTDTNRST